MDPEEVIRVAHDLLDLPMELMLDHGAAPGMLLYRFQQ
jgi:hypothetical protein